MVQHLLARKSIAFQQLVSGNTPPVKYHSRAISQPLLVNEWRQRQNIFVKYRIILDIALSHNSVLKAEPNSLK